MLSFRVVLSLFTGKGVVCSLHNAVRVAAYPRRASCTSPREDIMNIRVYSAPKGYVLVDAFTSAPKTVPPAQLVFSISGDRLPLPVEQMLESAVAQSGMLELRETWANYLFGEYPGWERHQRRAQEVVG